MAYKIAALVTLVAATAAVDITSSITPSLEARFDFPYTQLYHNDSSGGTFYKTYQPDLSQTQWNKRIYNTTSTGVWIYYDQINYNTWYPGQVTWTHGIDKNFDMPAGFALSLRYAGSSDSYLEDGFTLYEGMFFTGADFYGNGDNYTELTPKANSLIITGLSSWTFYTFTEFRGASVCANPTHNDTDTAKTKILSSGIYPILSDPWANSIMSAKKGCHSDTHLLTEPLEV